MRLLIVIVLALGCVTASAATLTGRTVRVTDGDTLVILSEGNVQHKIRLQGIDAPEQGQSHRGYDSRSTYMGTIGLPIPETISCPGVVVDEQAFNAKIYHTEVMRDISDRADYSAGYCRGLRRAFHGERFGAEEDHAHWISLSDRPDEQSRECIRGYIDAIKN